MSLVLDIAAALADASRLRIVMALRRGELCLCQMTALLELATSTVSRHVSILRQAGLVQSRKKGRWVYCRLAGREAPAPVRGALQWVARGLRGEPQVREDARRLAGILKIDPEVLCRRR